MMVNPLSLIMGRDKQQSEDMGEEDQGRGRVIFCDIAELLYHI